MFELKKRRRSLPLTCSRETEEFRRVAVRRKFKRHADSDVCISYNYRKSFHRLCGADPKFTLEPEEEHERSPAKRSLHKPHVPPKSHLQSPVKPRSPNLNRSLNGVSIPSLNCYSPSPVKAKNRPSSPAKATWAISQRTPRPILGSQGSVHVGSQNRSPQSEGKYSLNDSSPLSIRVRSQSPIHGKIWTYTPAKNSKSWLGINKIPKRDRHERSRPKSLSVPDLITYMEESSVYPEPDCSPLQPLQTSNISDPDVFNQTDSLTNETTIAMKGNDHRIEEAKIPVVNAQKFYCRWSEEERESEEHAEVEPAEKECVKDADGAEQKVCKIANEFLQTERAYVARLHLLDLVFCSRLTEEANRGSFPLEVVKNIFSNVSSIFSFHSQFLLPDLENCISHRNDCPGLGSVLLQHAPFMRMYADYVRNFDQSLDLVRTWTERSSAFRNIIQDIQSLEECSSLTLQHHMLEPVQRLPRYELLLRDYLKKLPEDHPDYQPAQESLQIVSMATVHSNSAIKKAEDVRKLLEIFEMVGEKEVVNPTNEFLKEGRLVKLAARNTSAMERRLFLFNNFLLCCSPKFSLVGQRYTVRCRIGMDGLSVQRTINEEHPFSFQVSGKEKTVELQASSKEERDDWIKVIQEAVRVFQKKNETFKTATQELIREQPMKELGRRAPKWIRDHEVTTCMKCNEPFNPLTRRRHHCRACGCVVCWKCSDNKVALEYDGNKLNRVCKSCFLILTTKRRERPRADSDSPILPSLMSGFLNYGHNPKSRQQTWAVLPKNDPTVLYLYAAPQDVKPLSTIPLLGYTMEKCPQEFLGQACFCLRQSKITHTFFCDHTDNRDRWTTVLKTAIYNTTPALASTDPGNVNVCNASSSNSDDYIIINNDTE
ncbi:FYVE, RhoGEF and PH domain-containing protein 4-like [Eucyclogobius newberryi]|uniref:FYVE, RhoGEF and PH domain-containing protein 4-like n=1 Tax=Eucyclogobius newberryi TaxID=166745 RepID=UPI003B5CDDF7